MLRQAEEEASVTIVGARQARVTESESVVRRMAFA
jgi:hypothetical protein